MRFPVPGEIAYALTDVAAAVRDEMVALAVWAFRVADEAGTEDRSTTVQVGGRPTARPTARPELDAAAALADELLRRGGPCRTGAPRCPGPCR